MMMTRTKIKKEYILSPFYHLPNSEDVVDFDNVPDDGGEEELKLLKNKELFILSNSRSSFFLINPIIRAFLNAFREAKTIEQVIVDFADASNCKPQQIEEVMNRFFQKMKRRDIIVSVENANKAASFMTDQPIMKREFLPGDKIGTCEVVAPLSIRGGTQLYVCKHPNEKENVVVKTMIFHEDLPLEARTKIIRGFRQEFLFMKELKSHPNICRLIELNTDGETPYAVIEKIEGNSLRSYIKKEETTIDAKLDIIHQILNVIAYVQEHEVIHGDLHLSNFLVTSGNGIKLIDFGLSNHAELEDDEIIRNGGVHECIPPERIKVGGFSAFKQRGDYRSEVFQLGVLIYFILYKKYPFSGFTWTKLARSIQEDILEYSICTADGQKVPDRLRDLLRIAMEKEPKNRFENATAMLSYFEGI